MALPHHTLDIDARGVATLTIANGTPLNILDSATIAAMTATLRRLARSDAVRALVLRGSGERALIGGANIHELAALEPDSAVDFISRLRDLCEAMRDFPAPTIARMAGWCMGGGLELAAACDLRIAAHDARFSMPEVRIGIPSVIHAILLARLIGEGHARWLLLTGAPIDAEKALRWGLVNEVAQPGGLDGAIEHTLAELLACGPRALRTQKALLRAWEEPHIERGIKESVAAFGASYETNEPAQCMEREFFSKNRQKALQGKREPLFIREH